MFTRRRRAPRPPTARGTAPHCRLCGTAVSVDEDGRCRLGHQVVAARTTEPVDPVVSSAPNTAGTPQRAVDTGGEEPRRVTASPLDTLVPEPASGAVPGLPADSGAAPTAEPPTAEPPTAGDAPADRPLGPPAATDDRPREKAEPDQARLLEASSWFTEG